MNDLAVIRDFLEWQRAINGGFSTLEAHQRLVQEDRPFPTIDEALAAVGRLKAKEKKS